MLVLAYSSSERAISRPWRSASGSPPESHRDCNLGRLERRPAPICRLNRDSLVARPGRLLLLDLLHDLFEVVGCWVLHRRVRDVGLELLHPQRLADGQHVPVVDVSSHWSGKSAGHAEEGLLLVTDGRFEGIALDVVDLG